MSNQLSRRQFLTLSGAAALAAPLAIVPSSDVAPDLTPSSLAWSKIPEENRSAWYAGQLWKNADITLEIDRRQAASIRWALSRRDAYPLVCYPDHPAVAARHRPTTEMNRRAAIIQIVEGLAGADLESLFAVARLFDQFPMDGRELGELSEKQRIAFEPGYWRKAGGE